MRCLVPVVVNSSLATRYWLVADSWPRSIDDSAAREEWGWEPGYDLAAMTVDMLEKLGRKLQSGVG